MTHYTRRGVLELFLSTPLIVKYVNGEDFKIVKYIHTPEVLQERDKPKIRPFKVTMKSGDIWYNGPELNCIEYYKKLPKEAYYSGNPGFMFKTKELHFETEEMVKFTTFRLLDYDDVPISQRNMEVSANKYNTLNVTFTIMSYSLDSRTESPLPLYMESLLMEKVKQTGLLKLM